MNRKRVLAILSAIALVLSIVIFMFWENAGTGKFLLALDIQADKAGEYKVYYSETNNFAEHSTAVAAYKTPMQTSTLEFSIPAEAKYIRIDFPETDSTVTVNNASAFYKDEQLELDMNLFSNQVKENGLDEIAFVDSLLTTKTTVADPYVVVNIDSYQMQKQIHDQLATTEIIYKGVFIAAIWAMFLLIALSYKRVAPFIGDIIRNRSLILKLSKNDFKTKYAGSYLGIIWAFVQPIVTIAVYWFVFEVGFRNPAMKEVPYVLWLATGLIPWFYFSEAWLGGTNSLLEYSYLVKKVVFKISILPVVKAVSALYVHVFFIAFMLVLYLCNGILPTIYLLQIVYYMICLFALILALSYISSAVVVFFRDLSQVINIFLQVGVWMTPIMWDNAMLGDKLQWVLKLNPVYYIVNGYRDSMISKVWFWERLDWTIYFWCFITIIFILATTVFKRLKPHFADVL